MNTVSSEEIALMHSIVKNAEKHYTQELKEIEEDIQNELESSTSDEQ